MPTELLRLAAAQVPGEGPIGIEFLSGGLGNEIYRVRRAGRSFSLRLARGPIPGPLSDRVFEFEVLQSAARAGVAPAVLLADPQQGLLISEWLEGNALTAAAASKRSAALVALLKAVHDLPIPAEPRLMTPGAWVDHYRTALRRLGAPLRGQWAEPLGRCLEELRALPESPRCVCHSDLHRLNVLEPPRAPLRLVLLDWEYAHVSEPLWDLAGWSANNDFAPAAAAQLVADYLGRAPSEAEGRKFAALRWLYDYVCLLWMELYSAVKPEQRSAFAARAAVLEKRLNSSVCGTIALPTNVGSFD